MSRNEYYDDRERPTLNKIKLNTKNGGFNLNFILNRDLNQFKCKSKTKFKNFEIQFNFHSKIKSTLNFSWPGRAWPILCKLILDEVPLECKS